MKAYKGFNLDMTCRGFQFEVGKTYIHDGDIELCESGFHACEAPLDVLNYYPPTALFAEVELDGVSEETHEQDTKRVAKTLTVKVIVSIAELVDAQIEWCDRNSNAVISKGRYLAVMGSSDYSTMINSSEASKSTSIGSYSRATSTGACSTTASNGDYSTSVSSGGCSKAASSGSSAKAASSGTASAAASSGKYSAAASSGKYSAAASSGDYSTAASSGDYSAAASSGEYSAAASSGKYSAAASSGGSSIAASCGDYSKAVSSGDYSKAEANGEQTIAMVAGMDGRARAGVNGAFALPWFDGKQVRIAVGVIGENAKADVWYYVRDGELIEDTSICK